MLQQRFSKTIQSFFKANQSRKIKMLNEMDIERPKSSFFPSFVECAPAAMGSPPEVVSHWSPKRTGIDLLDARNGVWHFAEALAFSREIRAPYFLVCVLKQMRVAGVGAMERAFLQELVSKAVAGGRGPQMNDQEASSLIILHGCDIETIRGVEAAARDFILLANRHRRPDALYSALMEWFRAQDNWVAEAVALVICGAAMKGAMH
jgi:hypothetical protein